VRVLLNENQQVSYSGFCSKGRMPRTGVSHTIQPTRNNQTVRLGPAGVRYNWSRSLLAFVLRDRGWTRGIAGLKDLAVGIYTWYFDDAIILLGCETFGVRLATPAICGRTRTLVTQRWTFKALALRLSLMRLSSLVLLYATF
jgi:hypothetical protein